MVKLAASLVLTLFSFHVFSQQEIIIYETESIMKCLNLSSNSCRYNNSPRLDNKSKLITNKVYRTRKDVPQFEEALKDLKLYSFFSSTIIVDIIKEAQKSTYQENRQESRLVRLFSDHGTIKVETIFNDSSIYIDALVRKQIISFLPNEECED